MFVVPLPLAEISTRSYWPLTVRDEWGDGPVWPLELLVALLVVLPHPVEKLIANAIRTARLQSFRFMVASVAAAKTVLLAVFTNLFILAISRKLIRLRVSS